MVSQYSQYENDDTSLFRIMVATDNHLGYLEHDQIRGDDSFVAFEEILSLSKLYKVDFLLLGGDLFHHHNPTKKTIIRASQILQKYVYGEQTHNYDVFCYEPNFKNPNLSIELPIFIIHGNHDDPSGFENFSSIDIFSNREVNYFGKVNNYEEFEVIPICLEKNGTKIALYGIGNIKDERLFLALQNKKVNFARPNSDEKWFNILIVHQNRFKGTYIGRSRKSFLPESFIPSFFNLVIWGHEHECFTEPKLNNDMGFFVYQPGSSVATSLIQAESKLKHIGLLEIKFEQFRLTPIRLQTVRPFIYHQFEMKDYALSISNNEDIERIIEMKIEEMLKEKEVHYSSNNLIPILRVKIEITGYNMIRSNFLVSKYNGKIANPADVIQYFKKTDPVRIHHDCHDDNENDIKQHLLSLEEEMAENYDGLKVFINQSINAFFSERKPLVSTDVFCDSLEKAVNGNEKKAVDTMYKNLFEYTIKNAKIDSNLLSDFSPFEKKDYSFLLDLECIKKFNKNKIVVSSNENSIALSNIMSDHTQTMIKQKNNKKGKKASAKEEIREEMEIDFDKVPQEIIEINDNSNEIKEDILNKPNLLNLGVEEEFILQSKDPSSKTKLASQKNNTVKLNTLDRFVKKIVPSNPQNNNIVNNSNISNINDNNNNLKTEQSNTVIANKRKYGITNELPMFKKKKN